MPAQLVKVSVRSIYPDKIGGPLPARMALAAPDTKAALHAIGEDLRARKGALVLSDLFRSYDMQTMAHMDYVAKRKKAFSPAAGGSMHEAGRAFDIDLSAIKMPLADFWKIAAAHGVTPIIDEPKAGVSESWHFERRGSHQLVYAYYKAGKGTNFKPAQAMAVSAILSAGIRVDQVGDNQQAAFIQSGLIRLSQTIGNIDGAIGPNSRKALQALGIVGATEAELVSAIDHKLQEKFPEEYFDSTPMPEGAFL
jgi:hypothetical protein